MKSTLLATLFVLLITTNSLGQLKGGLKGGVNLSDIIITNGADYFGDSNFESKVSYHFGSYVQNTFSKHFGYQIEMLFSNKGYKLKTDSLTTTVSLNYLNWPILLVYKLGNRFVFNAGIELGLLVTGENLYNGFDLGVDVGAEFDITKKILVGIRYSQGLPFDMNIESYDLEGSAPRYQNNVVQFYLGFNIVADPAASD